MRVKHNLKTETVFYNQQKGNLFEQGTERGRGKTDKTSYLPEIDKRNNIRNFEESEKDTQGQFTKEFQKLNRRKNQ